MELSSKTLALLGPPVLRPGYDRSALSVGIVHIGVGGFHRSHQAVYLDSLMNLGGAREWGICGVGLLDADRAMHEALAAQDGLYTVMTRSGEGELEARVIGSLVEHLHAPDDPEAVLARLCAPSTNVVSLTITEGGYNIDPLTGRFDTGHPEVRREAAGGAPRTVFGYLLEALKRRRDSGLAPFTVMSCDNIQSNGTVARDSLVTFAGLAQPELAEWIAREVAFPLSMVDRITPLTTAADREELAARFGISDRWPVVCEPFTQWVLEDRFSNGRPELEAVGVQITDEVEPYEQMKLRLLNAGHQALAYPAALAGYRYAHEAVADPAIAGFLRSYLNEEARPTLSALAGVDLDEYLSTLLARFANPAIRDTIARLCAFTSDRIPKWVVPVIQENLSARRSVRLGAAIVASWARYAEGRDERGEPLEIVDARHDELVALAAAHARDPLAFLHNRALFGDLIDDRRFTEPYLEALEAFWRLGVRGGLAALTARTRPPR